jgi:flagellar motility protein MotE (MotC chaperone)
MSIRLISITAFTMPDSVAATAPVETPAATAADAVPAPSAATTSAAGTTDPAAKKDGIPATSSAPPTITLDKNAPPPEPALGEHGYTAAEVDVLQSLSKRRDSLDKREQDVTQHEALLKAAEIEVDRKITELNKLKGELETLLNKQQTIQGERVESLVKIYEGMKPKEAARVFDTLDMDVLLAVVSKMSERKSSPIIANMDPEKARLVTIKITEQQKLPNLPETDKKPAPAAP